MNLSFKYIQFIIEAIDNLIETYQERLKNIEDVDEDEASDIGNDSMFLASLRKDLEKNLEQSALPSPKDVKAQYSQETETLFVVTVGSVLIPDRVISLERATLSPK